MSLPTAPDQLTEWPEPGLPAQETTRRRPRLHWAQPLTMLGDDSGDYAPVDAVGGREGLQRSTWEH